MSHTHTHTHTHTFLREMSYLSRERTSKIQPLSNWITNQIPSLTQYKRGARGSLSKVKVYCICDSVCFWTVAKPEADVCHRNIVTSNRFRAECSYIILFKVEGRAVPEKLITCGCWREGYCTKQATYLREMTIKGLKGRTNINASSQRLLSGLLPLLIFS